MEPNETRATLRSAPLDWRVLSLDARTAPLLASAATLQILTLAAQIFQAVLFGRIVAQVITHAGGPGVLTGYLPGLLIASVVVALSGYLQDRLLSRIAGRIKSSLRNRLLSAAGTLGRGERSAESETAVMLLATKGLDDIETYLVRFLPAAIYSVMAPIALISFTIFENPIAGMTELATLSVIPPLMITFGKTAGARAREKWQSLQRLSAQFVESISAIGTLKGIGAIGRQELLIADASQKLERDTMSTLYLAFLSTGALEVVTTVAIALVAVGIGIRLADGSITLAPSIAILMLAPVVYLAIRGASIQFHTSADARVAIDSIFELLHQDSGSLMRKVPGASSTVRSAEGDLVVERMGIWRGDLAVVEKLDLQMSPGDSLCILGPSGSGKTALLRAFAGLEPPGKGVASFRGLDLSKLSGEELSDHISYLPQSPTFIEASLRDNILFGRRDPGSARLEEVLEMALLSDLVALLPGGLDFRIPEFGKALSAGQYQRIALARALVVPRPLLILDEPTSHLDEAVESRIWRNLTSATAASVVVFATHRLALARTAAWQLELGSGRQRRLLIGEDSHG